MALKMVKIVLLLISVAFVKNSHGFDLFGNLSTYTEIVTDFISKKANERPQISYDCMTQFGWFLEDIVTLRGGAWAFEMIDASAKIPSGVLTFNVAWMGNYDQCLAIESKKRGVKGKYCLVGIKASNPITDELPLQVIEEYKKHLKRSFQTQLAYLPSAALCIPDGCSNKDIKTVLRSLTTAVPFSVTCQTKDDLNQPFDSGAIVTICYFGVFVLVMMISTVYDMYRDKTNEPQTLLIAFSVYTNGKKLLNTSKNSNEILCLNGIRVISMMWVIIGHQIVSLVFGPLVNFTDMFKYFRTTRSMLFANSVYAVDTFFVVGGFLVVYNFMKDNSQGRNFNIVRFYSHRYLRLTNAVLPVLFSTLFLMRYLGSGPFYPQTEIFSDTCSKYWWSTLLYVQNYVNVETRCLGHTWYLNVDFQLFLIAPAFLLFLPKRPIIGLSIMLCASMGSIIWSFVVTWMYKLQALETNLHGDVIAFASKYYMKTHTRAASWFIGAFLGYIMGKIKFQQTSRTVTIPKWLVGLNWILVLTVIPVCVFAGVDTLNSEEYHPYSNAFYNALAKPAWAVCISWIIFACSFGYGGFINTILSLPLFQILSKFTYSMYLLHNLTLYMISLAQKQPGYFSVFNLVYTFWGIFVFTLGLSIFWVLAFESPIPLTEKFVSGRVARLFKKKQEMMRNGRSTESIVTDCSVTTEITENILYGQPLSA